MQASTSAIEKQTDALRKQQKALAAYREESEEGESRRTDASEQLRRKYALEQQHVTMSVSLNPRSRRLREDGDYIDCWAKANELQESLTAQVATSQQKLKAANSKLTASVLEMLKSDDRLLEKLQHSVAGIEETEGPEGDSVAERAQALGAKLGGHKAEEVRCRLDHIFLEALPNDSEHSDNTRSDGAAQEDFLLDDLNSVYSDIDAVATMSVNHDYILPIIEQIAHSQQQDRVRYGAVLDYVCHNTEECR